MGGVISAIASVFRGIAFAVQKVLEPLAKLFNSPKELGQELQKVTIDRTGFNEEQNRLADRAEEFCKEVGKILEHNGLTNTIRTLGSVLGKYGATEQQIKDVKASIEAARQTEQPVEHSLEASN